MYDHQPEFWPQVDIFSPAKFEKTVHIIGVGAIGSHIALTLAKMGVEKIAVYDPDTVSAHNVPNQVYGIADIRDSVEDEIKKVDALARHIKEQTGAQIQAVAQEISSGEWKFPGIVFLCVDSMAARRYIYEEYIKLKLWVDLFIEVRMGAEIGKIYTIKPWHFFDLKGYEETLHSDEEAAQDECTAHAIKTTAEVIAGIACHKLTKWQRHILWQKEVIVSLNPILVTSRSW